MIKIHIGTSPLTNRIYAGYINETKDSWIEEKVDVTGPACGAVIEHVLGNKAPVIVNVNGEPKYEISVREL